MRISDWSSDVCSSDLILGTTLFASQAFAQEPESSTGEGQAIIVTGSRIARPTLDSPIPVTTVTATDLTRRGQTNVGDVLNDLPSLRPSFSQSNSTQSIGPAGLNLLDLRG